MAYQNMPENKCQKCFLNIILTLKPQNKIKEIQKKSLIKITVVLSLSKLDSLGSHYNQVNNYQRCFIDLLNAL